uniref:Uncharacterized protein n=1 Tax=Oryza meridionalis TaxID=40149 RepID=A0A0E0CXD6_9ORYZ
MAYPLEPDFLPPYAIFWMEGTLAIRVFKVAEASGAAGVPTRPLEQRHEDDRFVHFRVTGSHLVQYHPENKFHSGTSCNL